MAIAAVIRFPGSNCEFETAGALKKAGIEPFIYNWNQADRLALNRADAYVLPGGFSFQDRVRAGVIASRERMMDVIFEEAAYGKPVLGICNGAQILLESGLVPGWKPGAVQAALASNLVTGRSGYLSRWVFLRKTPGSSCPWLSAMDDSPIPVPIAHAEGRFMFRSDDSGRVSDHLGLVYSTVEGEAPTGWPDNPNGSHMNAAGLTNAGGNVLAMMPHPERAMDLWQVPPGLPGEVGRGQKGSHCEGTGGETRPRSCYLQGPGGSSGGDKMSVISIAVRLKAPDPEAVTALNAINGMGLQLPPAKLARYDIWEFSLETGGEETLREIVGHFTDIVNPNKHLWSLAEPGKNLPWQDDSMNWTGVLVSDREDNRGNNWASILKRRGFPVEAVHRRTLWMFGYLREIDDSLAAKLAMDLSVSGSRTGGLLSNPVSQEVIPWT